MAKTRVIYQQEAVYVGPTPSNSGHYKYVSGSYTSPNVPTQKLNQLDPLTNTGVMSGVSTALIGLSEMKLGLRPNLANLDRIQSVNYSFNIPRKDVNQYGNLAALDRVVIEQPTVNVDFTYLQNGMKNESEMGLDVNAIKRSAVMVFTTTASTSLISGITILDGGQGYTNDFTGTFAGTTPASVAFRPAISGLYAGQITGTIVQNTGAGLTIFFNGGALSPSTAYTVAINTGITNAGSQFIQALSGASAEGTPNQIQFSCISGVLNKTTDDNNIFVRTVAQGNDVAVATTGTLDQNIIAFGNTVISNYTVNGAVGEFPKASVTNECLNMSFLTGGNNYTDPNYRYPLPAIDANGAKTAGTFSLPDFNGRTDLNNFISVFRPGGIVLDLSAYAALSAGATGLGPNMTQTFNAQNYSLSFDLKRENLRRIGSTFAYSKEISFPVPFSLTVGLLAADMDAGNLTSLVSGDPNIDLAISYIKPGTENSPYGRITGVKYTLKGVKLSSQDYSMSIGNNKTINLKFDGQLGSPQDTNKGLFMNADWYMYNPEII